MTGSEARSRQVGGRLDMDFTLEGPAAQSVPLLLLVDAEIKRLSPSTVTFTSLREKPAEHT